MNGSMKSNLNSYLEIVECIYHDASAKCIAKVSDLRDLKTIRTRTKREGLSFLTILLPAFCRDFERSLDVGRIDPTLFRNFKKRGAIPEFLQGMLGHLFCPETGVLYDPQIGNCSDSTSTIVEAVRQICLAFKKVELPCSQKRNQDAIQNFSGVELDLQAFSLEDSEVSGFRQVCAILYGAAISGFIPETARYGHGPGEVEEKISQNEKWLFRRWHDRLEVDFPFFGTGAPLGALDVGERYLDSVTFVAPDDERPVRVVFVPKTLKSPRVIAIEPACNQFVQQGIKNFLYESLESHDMTKGHINFSSQRINREIVLSSSATGQYASIDLSDASDRVPLSLVEVMLESNPVFRDQVLACRSTRAILPDGDVLHLRKFASMGSALCFPVEAMYFYAICVKAICDAHDAPYTGKNLKKFSRQVFVYGDDILVPSHLAITVLDHLHKYNCKVNSAKSFWTGRFRESCGLDAYGGVEVTPTYIRQPRPENRQQANRIVSWIATAQQFEKRGYWRSAYHLYEVVERLIGKLPTLPEQSEGLGKVLIRNFEPPRRWNRELQRFEVRAFVSKGVDRTDQLEGFPALAKSLSVCDGPLWSYASYEDRITVIPSSTPDVARLAKSARRGAVVLKRSWVPVT